MNVSFATLVLAAGIGAAILLCVVFVMFLSSFRRQAQRLGYPSLGAYLKAAPRSDDEKREAVSLAMTGPILCLLGLVFPPFLLIGLFPLFYGARKVAWASMGLGLVDDGD
jgi:hypothetical protein